MADTQRVEPTPSRSLRPSAADAARIACLEAEVAGLRRALAARERSTGQADIARLAADELRAPATAVSGYLDILVDGDVGPLAPDQQHLAECAAFHVRHLIDVVDDLVTVTHLQVTHRALAVVDLSGIVRGRIQQITPLAASRGVRLEMHLSACPEVVGDGATLARAVECLLEQAVMFSPRARTVVCAVHPAGGGVVIEVSDEGMTLDPRGAEALLGGRAPSGTTDPRTLLAPRLGLLMVRMVADAHGGRVEIASDTARTSVRMILPACV